MTNAISQLVGPAIGHVHAHEPPRDIFAGSGSASFSRGTYALIDIEVVDVSLAPTTISMRIDY
jgi:hypothetical protein